MRELIIDLLSSGWTWPLLFGVVALDALVQCLPSATSVTVAGMLAASGQLNIFLLIAVVAAAAFTGDNLVYRFGRRAAPRLLSLIRRRERGRRACRWARRNMASRPASVIVLGRYMSGARLPIMITAGTLGCTPVRFRRIDAFAATLWASTTALTGYLGGSVFAGRPVAGLLLAFGTGSLVAIVTRAGLTEPSTRRSPGRRAARSLR